MATYIDNYNNIKQSLRQAFLEVDLSYKLEGVKKLITQIDFYLNKYEQTSKGIVEKYNNSIQEEPNLSNSTRRYQAVKTYNEQVDSIQNLLKQGYLYVDAIREILTGQTIQYEIGIIKEGILYENNVDLLTLIETSTLDVDSKISIGNAAKLRLKSGELSAKILQNPIEQIIQEEVDNASSIFSAVYNYFTNSIHQTPKVNKGNAYEVYKRLIFERNNLNKIPPAKKTSIEEINKIYEEVKRNNAAYYKGGDINDIQVKYLGNTPPSLTSLSSIKRVLTKTKNALLIIYDESKPKQKVVESLVNLFTQNSTKITNDIERKANDEAKEHIRNKLMSIQGLALNF